MRAEERLDAALRFASNTGNGVTLALASVLDGRVECRSLNLSAEVAQEFDRIGRGFMNDLRKLRERGELMLRSYDGAYKPEDHELEFVYVPGSTLEQHITDIRPAADIPLIDLGDGFIDRIRFYVLVIERERSRLLLFRRFGRNKELTRSKNILVRWMGDRFEHLDEPTFQFDDKFDAFFFCDHVFSCSKNNFQYVFQFYEALRAVAHESLAAICSRVPIANQQEFEESCKGHLQKLEKLRSIARKEYLARVTIDDVKRTIAEFDLDVEVVCQGGVEKILFDPRDRWAILHLLDDAYLGSQMTGYKYEANSKRQVQ